MQRIFDFGRMRRGNGVFDQVQEHIWPGESRSWAFESGRKEIELNFDLNELARSGDREVGMRFYAGAADGEPGVDEVWRGEWRSVRGG